MLNHTVGQHGEKSVRVKWTPLQTAPNYLHLTWANSLLQ